MAEEELAASDAESPEQAYVPYMQPTDILMSVYGKTEAGAQEILDGITPSKYPNAAYVHDSGELVAAAGNSAVQIIVMTSKNEMLSDFTESASVSSWAKKDFWRACSIGLLNGEVKKDGTKAMQSQRHATRAEAAQVIYNYVKLADIIYRTMLAIWPITPFADAKGNC